MLKSQQTIPMLHVAHTLQFDKDTALGKSLHPSALTAVLAGVDSSQDVDDVLKGKGKSEQSVDRQGRAIIKELPWNKATHV